MTETDTEPERGTEPERDGHLVDVEVLPEEGPLLRGGLLAVVGQDVAEGLHGVVRLPQCERLAADGEVDVVLGQRPAPRPVHLHGLAVAAQRVPLLEDGHRHRGRESLHSSSILYILLIHL